jgi:hypothetical protein
MIEYFWCYLELALGFFCWPLVKGDISGIFGFGGIFSSWFGTSGFGLYSIAQPAFLLAR